MSCVYEPQEFDLSCVRSIISDFTSGEISTTTARKALKLIDTGLAIFGKPTVSLEEDVDLVAKLQSLVPEEGEVEIRSLDWVTIISILIKLLKEML